MTVPQRLTHTSRDAQPVNPGPSQSQAEGLSVFASQPLTDTLSLAAGEAPCSRQGSERLRVAQGHTAGAAAKLKPRTLFGLPCSLRQKDKEARGWGWCVTVCWRGNSKVGFTLRGLGLRAGSQAHSWAGRVARDSSLPNPCPGLVLPVSQPRELPEA